MSPYMHWLLLIMRARRINRAAAHGILMDIHREFEYRELHVPTVHYRFDNYDIVMDEIAALLRSNPLNPRKNYQCEYSG